MKTETIILASAILLTGLMAGIFFTWSNAVKPGIGKLSDLEYLRSLQSMNRVILNKAFIGIFLGAIIAVALVPIFHFKLAPNSIFWLLLTCSCHLLDWRFWCDCFWQHPPKRNFR